MRHKVTNKELIYKHKSIGHKTSKITELNMKHEIHELNRRNTNY